MKRRHRTKIDDAAYYEKVWTKEEYVRGGHHFDTVRMRALTQDIPHHSAVLDIGAGVFGAAQFLSEHVLDRTLTLVAFDQSYTAAGIVIQTCPEIVWVIGDAEKRLPFIDKQFDVVIAGEIIEHMEYPENFANELMRVGECVVLSTLDHDCPQAQEREYPEHIWAFYQQDLERFFPGGVYERCGNYHLIRWST